MTRALEADLLSEYRVDLVSYWRREMSLRKLLVLIDMLPQDSRLMTAFGKRPVLSRTDMAAMQIHTVNAISSFMYMYASAHTEKGKPPPRKPDFIELPEPRKLSQPIEKLLAEEKKRAAKRKKKHKFANIAEIHSWIENLQKAG